MLTVPSALHNLGLIFLVPLRNLFLVQQKFFPLDKNYVLEEVQLLLSDSLLLQLIEEIKMAYELTHNPLGIADSFSIQIQKYKPLNLHPLRNFYQTLAGIYRYKWGHNQLEFVWDGREHTEKYKADWIEFFKNTTALFCQQQLFIQAVLDLTVFMPLDPPSDGHVKEIHLTENRMNHFMLQQFEVKMHRNKGIVSRKLA